MAFKRTPRQSLHENELSGSALTGSLKERLETKPEPGAHKKRVGDVWRKLTRTPFASEPAAATNNKTLESGISQPRIGLPLGRRSYQASFDDVNGQEHARAANLLATGGFAHPVDPLNERGTDDANEYFYETVEDKETGNKGLTYRNKMTGRP